MLCWRQCVWNMIRFETCISLRARHVIHFRWLSTYAIAYLVLVEIVEKIVFGVRIPRVYGSEVSRWSLFIIMAHLRFASLYTYDHVRTIIWYQTRYPHYSYTYRRDRKLYLSTSSYMQVTTSPSIWKVFIGRYTFTCLPARDICIWLTENGGYQNAGM